MKVLVNSLVWLALQGLENTMEVTTASYTPLEELLVENSSSLFWDFFSSYGSLLTAGFV